MDQKAKDSADRMAQVMSEAIQKEKVREGEYVFREFLDGMYEGPGHDLFERIREATIETRRNFLERDIKESLLRSYWLLGRVTALCGDRAISKEIMAFHNRYTKMYIEASCTFDGGLTLRR